MAECCDEEDEDGFIPYERKSQAGLYYVVRDVTAAGQVGVR